MWARAGFAVLTLALAVGFFVFPTYPNYDSYYSMLWGREIVDGTMPHFEGFRVPTEHPLAIAFGLVLGLFGEGSDRVWIALIFASFLGLVWGIYRLGRIAFTPLVGALAAALLVSRFDFPFLAARGYIDVPYMALVVWAAALEAAKPRRGTGVLVLLGLAGLLRPEAWVMSFLYWLWLLPHATWGERVKFAALGAAAPVIWALVDWVVTGNPLFSLVYTSGSAEDLGRQRTLSEIPGTLPTFFLKIVKAPVFAGALAGLALSILLFPRRAVMPIVLLCSAILTFFAIGAAGLSVIDRYLVIGGLALLVFAGVALGGWTMLERGRRRTAWMAGAVALIVYGLVFSVTHINLNRLENELRFRGDSHAELKELLDNPKVIAGFKCGPLSLPNHKLVPDARWIADLPFDRVYARADRWQQLTAPYVPRKGVAIYVTSRIALFKHAFSDPGDGPSIQIPPPNFERVAVTDYYTAYVAC